MATNRIFRGFCINRFGLGPLHYISSRSDFGFEFAEIFVFEKRLPVSVSRGVDKIAWSSNGNASETKANESFDIGVFFDIEAKRTPSKVSKLFSKRSEHIR